MNQNIIIKEISEDKISLNINGEMREIQNQLSELKSLIASQEGKSVQYAEKIYNIEHINEANFGFITGKKAFNETLTKALIEAIKGNSRAANKFLEKAEQHANWEKEARIGNKAKEIIAYSFVGTLGVQLSKLMAIGKEDFSETKQNKYLKQAFNLTKIGLDLMSFVMISYFWDSHRKTPQPISAAQQAVLQHFLGDTFERSIEASFRLLCALSALFADNQLKLPFEDLQHFVATELKQGTDFEKLCQAMQALNQKYDKAEHTLLDCFEAEVNLGNFLAHLGFLVNYKMVSIKNVAYNEVRNKTPNYLHYYAALGIDSKANVDAEKLDCVSLPVHTPSILFFKNDYQKGINLFPFVIDYNALTNEAGTQVCFYSHKALEDDSLEYIFLEDRSFRNITLQKIKEDKYVVEDFVNSEAYKNELNEFLKDKAVSQKMNLNYVYLLFEEAENSLTSKTSKDSSLDEFDVDFSE